ncbi:glycoside hydrolase family 64 protein [Teratosphaeria destructans]|uniref:Glycoside hydrolase family 64 protein n=1 Tax=Teratosphaeria destructans TaxID=418781 RepID=A0A9W7SSR4_9PEZI|nr:glycoside hydrolase family 64 protein [Teratosphaeria destructans]
MLPPACWLGFIFLASIFPRHQALVLSNATNASTSGVNASDTPTKGSPNTGGFKLSLVNLLGTSDLHAYVTGQDIDGKLLILDAAGSDWVTPPPNGENITGIDIILNGDQTPLEIALPSVIYSARVWLAQGYLNFSRTAHADNQLGLVQPSVNPQDSSIDTTWGFVEFSSNASDASAGMTADLSYVDFVGLPLGIALNDSDASRTQTRLGLKRTAVADICHDLRTKPPPDGQPWHHLCVRDGDGRPSRVLAPTHYMAQNTSAFADYFRPLNDRIWTRYHAGPLTIDTQSPTANAS